MHKVVTSSLISVAVLGITACDVEQTEQGELPDVQVEEGNMPEYDVDTADVDVGTETETVEVPTLDVEEADAGEPGPK